MATMMGRGMGVIGYLTLVLAAYLSTLALILGDILSPWAMLVLLTSPLAVRNIRRVIGSHEKPEIIASLDVDTARLHLAFGILLPSGVIGIMC